MTIKTYWEKVDKSRKVDGMHPVIKGEYDLKDVCSFAGGWNDPEDYYRERCKGKKSYMGREGDTFRHDLGTQYGIHSYQEVTP